MTQPRDNEADEGWCADCHHWPEEHGDQYHDLHCECRVAEEAQAS